MKNAILLHGLGSNPQSFWFPYLKKKLEEKGYSVWAPQLPNADIPDINIWLPYILENGQFNGETVLVGHSAGAPLILSILENINTKVKQAILVAGFITPLDKENPEPILQDSYNWEKIKQNCGEFIFINSDNDPWG